MDEFAELLLEEAKRFLEKANETSDASAKSAFIHASLMLGFCALEAHVNSVCDELAPRPEFTVHERALLLEQDVKLENGEFKSGGLRIARLEDRILFLHQRMSGTALDKATSVWSDLTAATKLRNQLTHPKAAPNISIEDVSRALGAIIGIIDVVYRAVYARPFPFATMALDSKLTF
jgi:hypothetical protein